MAQVNDISFGCDQVEMQRATSRTVHCLQPFNASVFMLNSLEMVKERTTIGSSKTSILISIFIYVVFIIKKRIMYQNSIITTECSNNFVKY